MPTTLPTVTHPIDDPNLPTPLGDLDEVKVVLFDLDGTLHVDLDVTDFYARALAENMPDGTGQGLIAEVTAVINGTHPSIRPGHFVEPVQGIVSAAENWVAEKAIDWAGNEMPLPETLSGQIQHDGPLRYMGDHWQIIGALASHRGASPALLRDAFTRARNFANDPSTALMRSEFLDQVLHRLGRGRKLLLATNTPEGLALPLVMRLGIHTHFEVIRFDARKPAGCAELIVDAMSQWKAEPSEVLVVGDNLWNDLLPLSQKGCRTVHIDPLGTDPAGRWSSARYTHFAAFAAALEEMPDAN
jgi:FMN phosphatase YigB (HAD superfamily)